MKNLLLGFILFAWAGESLSQQLDLYGFERRVDFAGFVCGDSCVLGYGNDWMLVDGTRRLGRKLILWNAQNGEQLIQHALVDLEFVQVDGQKYRGMLGKAELSPDRKRLYILGRQYQGGGKQIQSLFHVYHIEQDSFSVEIVDADKQILSFQFNKNNQNMLTCIYLGSNSGIYVGKLDLRSDQGISQLRSYQQLVQPLSLAFSSCGRFLYIGLGINSKQGALEVFDIENNKMIKKLNTKEHVLGVFDFDNTIYCQGVESSMLYQKSSLKFLKSNTLVLRNVSHSQGLAFVVPQKVEALSKIAIQNLKTGTTSTIELPYNLFESFFNGLGNQILSIVEKNEFDQSEDESQKPSLVIHVLVIE